MLDLQIVKKLSKALVNAAHMTAEERYRRVQMVKVSGRIYHAGMALWREADGMDHELADEALDFLDETKVLEISRVWELQEANTLLTEIQDWSRELRQIRGDHRE